ncbi:MAG: hypothetical protein ABJA02_13310 [Acidobacteriota bacterium]
MRTTLIATLVLALCGLAYGQKATTFSGTALIYGSGMNTRTITRTFNLRVTGVTSPTDAASYLTTLTDHGQDALLNDMSKNDLGRFSLGGSIGSPLSAVIVDEQDGKTRVRAVFQRWMGFGEIRGGYRSTDYPFGYVEVLIDPRTGKGEGTFIPAAKIRFRSGKNGGADTVEIEDFGTFPGRLMGVQMTGAMLR